MLVHLHIRNYAIIEEIDISFGNGLSIITGETGAGKSILMGALSLVLGARADTSSLLSKEKKCIIEATFKNNDPAVKEYLLGADLDAGDEITIRREISTNGKSRAFINDTPVNLSHLNKLSSRLVDVHEQFDTLELADNDFHRQVIDSLANNGANLAAYQQLYKKMLATRYQLELLVEKQMAANKEADYNQFLFNELEQANFKQDELEELESELSMLSNAEGIKSTLSTIYFQLQESERPLVQQLRSIANQLQAISSFHPDISALSSRLVSTQVELQDIAGDIDRINDSVKYDADKIDHLNERISTGQRLLKKYGVQTTSELIVIQEELQKKLEVITSLDEQITEGRASVKKIEEEAKRNAVKISAARQKQVKPFEEKVNKLLQQVGMPNAKLKVQMSEAGLNMFGKDNLDFLFDANKTGRFEPIHKVASGGELSRLMLCIKSLVAASVQLPTLIFDEIDTGISGEAARQAGIIMKQLSDKHQVISITHQPQIAAKATAHYFVYKRIVGDKIITSVRLLDHDERITTIATMLSGEKPGTAAFENARELLR